MQIGKYIMVVGLLSLFFSFGYADSKGITEQQAKAILEDFPELSEGEQKLALNILKVLDKNGIKVSDNIFYDIAESSKNITDLMEIIP